MPGADIPALPQCLGRERSCRGCQGSLRNILKGWPEYRSRGSTSMAHSRRPIPGLETGSNLRKEFSTRTKALAFQRANGRCEGEGCGARLTTGKFHYDHRIPDGLTGSNDIANCAVLCTPCHREKTRGDVGTIAEAKRRHTRDIGARTSRQPLPGGKRSKWKKKLDGTVVLR
jgi:5-methylcytosine-specific restriction protein A